MRMRSASLAGCGSCTAVSATYHVDFLNPTFIQILNVLIFTKLLTKVCSRKSKDAAPQYGCLSQTYFGLNALLGETFMKTFLVGQMLRMLLWRQRFSKDNIIARLFFIISKKVANTIIKHINRVLLEILIRHEL